MVSPQAFLEQDGPLIHLLIPQKALTKPQSPQFPPYWQTKKIIQIMGDIIIGCLSGDISFQEGTKALKNST